MNMCSDFSCFNWPRPLNVSKPPPRRTFDALFNVVLQRQQYLKIMYQVISEIILTVTLQGLSNLENQPFVCVGVISGKGITETR